MMTKKQFIALADAIRAHNAAETNPPIERGPSGGKDNPMTNVAMKKLLYPYLEACFARLESFAGQRREFFAICQHCGRNRYTGEACTSRRTP